LLSQLLERSGVAATTICPSVEAALEWLETIEAGSASMPEAAFVDVRLPAATGFDFLIAVRESPKLRHMLVVLLSASEEPRNLGKAAQLGANGFLIKFPTVTAMRDVVASIQNFSPDAERTGLLPIAGNLLLGTPPAHLPA